MKNNLLSIKINISVEDLFNFTINPDNTHKWIPFIDKEWIEWDNIEKWTIYKNSRWKDINKYEVINIEKNSKFHLKSLDSKYEVIYFYIKISKNECILNYYEFMSDWNILWDPFEQKILKNLKTILETK